MQTDAALLANNSQHNLRSGPILAVLIHSLERLPLKLVFVSPYPREYVTKRNENWAWSQVTPNTVGCYMLRPLAHLVVCCCVLLRAVGQSLKPVKLLSQQLPTFLLFRDRRSVAQQCWIRLHSSSNIGGATHSHYTWSQSLMGCILRTMHCRSSTLLRVHVASVCAKLNFARSHSVGSKLYRRNTKWKTLLVL